MLTDKNVMYLTSYDIWCRTRYNFSIKQPVQKISALIKSIYGQNEYGSILTLSTGPNTLSVQWIGVSSIFRKLVFYCWVICKKARFYDVSKLFTWLIKNSAGWLNSHYSIIGVQYKEFMWTPYTTCLIWTHTN